MKFYRLLFMAGVGLWGCGFCAWVAGANLLVSVAAPQLPFGSAQVQAWQLGVPQDTYGAGADYVQGLFAGGRVEWADYSGSASFLCGSPVEQGYVTSTFDDVRDGGAFGQTPRLHGGIDYGTHQRELPVRALMGGQVTFAGWSDVGYGLLVVIENDGVQLYLGHNSAITVALGEIVSAGDIVAMSGDTGNSTGPHVHVEFRQKVELADGTAGSRPFDPRLNFMPGQIEPCGWDEAWAPWADLGE